MVAAAQYASYNEAIMNQIDLNRRTFRGKTEVRMLLTAAEIAFLCDIQPVHQLRTTIHARGSKALGNIEGLEVEDYPWPRAKLYVPDDVPFMVPMKNGRTMALPAIDALYAFHQSQALLDRYWMPLIDGDELILATPTALPADLGWYKQLIGAPHEPVTIPDGTATTPDGSASPDAGGAESHVDSTDDGIPVEPLPARRTRRRKSDPVPEQLAD